MKQATLDMLTEIETAAREINGLISVPAIMRDPSWNHGLAIDALLALDRAGVIELRPESGMGRLSRVDANLCPVAWDGTPLSWIRLL